MSIYRRKLSQEHTHKDLDKNILGGDLTHHKDIKSEKHNHGGELIIPDYKYVNNIEYKKTDNIKYPKKLLDKLLEENFSDLTTNEKLIVMYKTQAIRLEDLENKLLILMFLLAFIILKMYIK
tara:strand:- start:31 stop:396 length:366 start_codon:yes stop_codon:yes gene_type:complete